MLIRYKKWEPEEVKVLLDDIGSFGWKALERRSKHSKTEIWAKVNREFGGGGITRGSYSLSQAMDETGYARSQFIRASKALNQRWLRTAKGGNYLITAEQLEDMVFWLKDDFWSAKHHLYGCMQCEGSKDRHYAIGLCFKCYHKVKRYVKRTFKIRFTTEYILKRLDSSFTEGSTVIPFLEQIRNRLKLGKCPPIKDLEKVRILCNL